MDATTKPLHIGRKITRLRELRGIKQEALAAELGMSQQAISRLESSATIADDVLEKVAKALGVTVEGIRHFTEESVFNNINNFHDHAVQNNFNPIEKVVELYERLVKAEKEKVEMLERLLREK